MTKGPTPRELARAENLERIKRLALEQLADTAAAELSLRAIARELNIVSSAIYRYFASRDDLITALIIDTYDDLAAHLDESGSGRAHARRRWIRTCGTLRDWAVAEPHRFALIYGSAIPGYRAPQETIEPAGRVIAAVIRPILESDPTPPAPGWAQPGRRLSRQLSHVNAALGTDLPHPVLLGAVGAFTRVIGALTLELNGHFAGGFEPADDLFAALVEQEATALGL